MPDRNGTRRMVRSKPVMFMGESPFYDRAAIVEAVTGLSLFGIDGALPGDALVNPFEFR